MLACRVLCLLSCQGSPESATLLATFEEHLRQTGSVRQATPPDIIRYMYIYIYTHILIYIRMYVCNVM